jgi:hypothetical protein
MLTSNKGPHHAILGALRIAVDELLKQNPAVQ